RESSRQQVFLDGEVSEAMPAFHDLDAAAPDQIVWRQAVDPLAVELDRALGDLTPLRPNKVRDCLERRGLAGTVRTEQCHDPAFRHFQGHTLQYEDDVVVD